MKSLIHAPLSCLIGLAICGVVSWTAARPQALLRPAGSPVARSLGFSDDHHSIVRHIDERFESRWRDAGLTPAEPADEFQIFRRLTLALFGSIPSLEDLREFEADDGPDRLTRWAVTMLSDDRCADYLAERLSVAFLGDRDNDFPGFRRERFAAWLSGELKQGRHYDEIVRQTITATGQPTVSGPANFLSAEIAQGDQYATRLAGRTARAFLGQRIDCAECHDHPFADWKQADFQGLAAYFGQLARSNAGLYDARGREHMIENRKTQAEETIAPCVPFHPEWLADRSPRREQLAKWVTHPDNRRFRQAIANRVWGLMFGKPYFAPVDDLPDPDQPETADATKLLDLLGDDFAAHGFDVRRLALVTVSSRPFRLASTHPQLESPEAIGPLNTAWAVFPLVQLRTEQVSRSLQQARTVQRLRSDDDVITRTHRAHWQKEFSEQYGSLGELELDERGGSIQQMVERMAGRFTNESINSGRRGACRRIAEAQTDDRDCVDASFLVCLSRRPTQTEQDHFLEQLRSARRAHRLHVVEDAFWAMINSPEFIWNH
ncbi:MAG: DUF1549 domain-containing protein [Planctomycetia bacterium]|nr:DUF1549 domain-containing protein [Planctomycetia bacterium]